jgi:hypothetical protein
VEIVPHCQQQAGDQKQAPDKLVAVPTQYATRYSAATFDNFAVFCDGFSAFL